MAEVQGLFGFAAPPLAAAPYTELAETPANAVDRWLDRRAGEAVARLPFLRSGYARQARAVLALEPALRDLPDDELRAQAQALRPRLLARRSDRRATVQTLALVREASARVLGRRHYPVQIMGALALLDGRLVEMATGEGKTLTAAPAAIVAALAGDPVHVVTVNDYLARRDAEDLRPLYDFFGLTVGIVEAETETDERRAGYACDITHVANKTLAFDYLRDRIALGRMRGRARRQVAELAAGGAGSGLFLRGLAFAIVDEADSVFVDEARTPLILSASTGDADEARRHQEALSLARSLCEGVHYRIDRMNRQVTLSGAGQSVVSEATAGLPGLWRIRRAREELAEQALSALHLYHLGRDYVVIEEKVQIVDEFTGRVMPDRSWQGGLHQLIETKEGLPPTDRKETLARVTYQRFFRRYRRLAGMTGTGFELSGEFREIYRLFTIRVPTNRPRQRRHLSTVFVRSETGKWQLLARRVAALHAAGRPVLIGTRSVEASEQASAALAAAGLGHKVLNAKQDKDEAAVVAEAGQSGAITVATNIAGRGTDIHLGPGVREAGGLHVILTEFHESRRIDRQLYGRAGRQGDPGSTEAIVSLEDALFTRYAPRLLAVVRRLPVWPLTQLLLRAAQARAEAENAATRAESTRSDRELDKALAFAGPVE
ncbi:MAG TPA: translocase [Paracoccaceae bacterium]|nr:translocase [Paracoccaceae bacterium]